MPSYNHKTAITEAWWSLLHSLREPLQVVMNSKRTRDQTSPTGSTPYALSKRAPRDATDLQTPSIHLMQDLLDLKQVLESLCFSHSLG